MLLKASCSLSPVAPCISITESKKFLFISSRQSSKAEEKGVTGEGRCIETEAGAVKNYKCQTLQGPSLRRAHWGHSKAVGMEMEFCCSSLFMILASHFLLSQAPGDRGWETFPAFSLWEAAQIKTVFLSAVGREFQRQLFVGYML